ncbi:MAG: Xaa-Pro dipeptidase [Thermoleophilaceae bacterium]|nr:Xaa-Pro dipeptidase [Thermoleophilaceae bacterium]
MSATSAARVDGWRQRFANRPEWERLDFHPEEYADRQARVRAVMEDAGCDVLLIIEPKNINWLIGFRAKSYQEFQCLVFPLEDEPLTIICRMAEVAELTDLTLADEVRGWSGREPGDPVDVLSDVLRERGHLTRRVGVECPYYYLSAQDHAKITALLGDAYALDATSLIEPLKLVKSPAELALIRRAAGIADRGMHAAVLAIREGASEFDVAAALYHSLLSNGSDLPASPVNFMSGDRTCYGHGAATERRLRRGDPMHLEYGAAYHRYTSTIGRNLSLGEPSPRHRELHDINRAACDALIAAVRPGISSEVPHLEAKRVIAEAGLDAGRVHTSGYGIAPGFPPSYGESIHFHSGYPYSPAELREGMVMTIEPPIFLHAERLGVRLLDNLVVTADGAELLSTYPRDLLVVG